MVESGRSTDKPIKHVYFSFWRMRWGSGTPQKSLHCTKCRFPSAYRRGGRKGQQTSGFWVAALTDSTPRHTHTPPQTLLHPNARVQLSYRRVPQLSIFRDRHKGKSQPEHTRAAACQPFCTEEPRARQLANFCSRPWGCEVEAGWELRLRTAGAGGGASAHPSSGGCRVGSQEAQKPSAR